MNTKTTAAPAVRNAELFSKLLMLMPIKALDSITKQHSYNPQTVECTPETRIEIMEDVLRLSPEWVAEVVEQKNDYKLSDVLHDFYGIYSEDEHFLPRIQPTAPAQKLESVSNYRQIKIKYISPTNTRGSRVCIYEPKRYNNDKTEKVFLSYDYSIGCIQQQALNYLVSKGFNIVAKASELENYIFLADNWADEFRELKTGLIRE